MNSAATPVSTTASSHRWLLALVAIVAGGFALRLLFLGNKAIWLDEAFSVWFSDQSWHYLWHEVPQFETHPSMYYSLLKLWRGFGSEEMMLRLPSVLANVASIALVALTGYIVAPRSHRLPLAAAAAFLLATSPLQLSLAQQARPYALLMFGMGLALAAGAWIVMNPERAARPLWRGTLRDGSRLAAYLALGLGMAVLLWMHNVGAVFVATLGGFLIAWWAVQRERRGALFCNLLAAAMLAFALYAPNLPTLLMQTQAVTANFWLNPPTPAEVFLLALKLYGQWEPTLVVGLAQLVVQLLLSAPLAILGITGTWQLCKDSDERRWAAGLLLSGAFGSLALMLAISYTAQPVLMDRTLAPAQLPWVVLSAAAPFGTGRLRRTLGWTLIAAAGAVHLAGFISSQATQAQRDALRPWRSLATIIAASDAAAAPVVILPNSAALALGYYNTSLRLKLTIHPLPEAYPARGAAYRYPVGGGGEVGLDKTMLPRLYAATAEASTVWLITRLEDVFDPQQIARRALARRYPCAESTAFGRITVTRFDRMDESTSCTQESIRHGS